MREYLDTVVKTGQGAQYLDDSGSEANSATGLTAEFLGSLQVHSPGRTKADLRKMSICCLRKKISWPNYFARRSFIALSEDSQNFDKLKFPKSKRPNSAIWDS